MSDTPLTFFSYFYIIFMIIFVTNSFNFRIFIATCHMYLSLCRDSLVYELLIYIAIIIFNRSWIFNFVALLFVLSGGSCMWLSRWLNPFQLTLKNMWYTCEWLTNFNICFKVDNFRCRAKLYHFETSTTKNLFDNCCYLYISMILVILEVVFQVFLRLLRVPQYSNQWACETGKHLHELSLYAHAMDYYLCRCYVCLFHDSIIFQIILFLFCSLVEVTVSVSLWSVKCENDPFLWVFYRKGKTPIL